MVVRPPLVWPWVSLPSFLSFALQRALVGLVPVGSLLPYGSQPSRWGHPCRVEAGYPRSERRFGMFLFPFGMFHLVPTVLRVGSPCESGVLVGSHLYARYNCCCLTLSLQALFLVVLAGSESLRMFLALSSVLPFPLLWFHVRLHSNCFRTWVCPWFFALVPSGWGSSLCLRRLLAPCTCWRISWWSSMRPRVLVSSGLSPGFFPFRGPTPISRLFLSLSSCWSRSRIPSLAPSWWSPSPLLRWALLTSLALS